MILLSLMEQLKKASLGGRFSIIINSEEKKAFEESSDERLMALVLDEDIDR